MSVEFLVEMVEQCAYVYLNVVVVTTAGGALQLEGSKSVVDSISTAGLDGPAAMGVGWVVVGKVQ